MGSENKYPSGSLSSAEALQILFKFDTQRIRNMLQQRNTPASQISGPAPVLQKSNGGPESVRQEEYAFAGHDPNDLQVDCPHEWEVATHSCSLCGKSWNSIFWSGKPCCNGGNGGPALYSAGKWHSTDCDSLKPPAPSDPYNLLPSTDYRPKPSFSCQCGAQATSNPNCHSSWCPEYKK